MASAFVELPASPSKGASSKGLAAGRISVPVTVRLNGVGLTLGAGATGVDVALLVSAVIAAGGRP